MVTKKKKPEPQPGPEPNITVEFTPDEPLATKSDVESLTEAVRELTKVVGDISAAWNKWSAAGKF